MVPSWLVPSWLAPSWQWREGWQDGAGCALNQGHCGRFVSAIACHFYLLKHEPTLEALIWGL